jgi:hypothetical protein
MTLNTYFPRHPGLIELGLIMKTGSAEVIDS